MGRSRDDRDWLGEDDDLEALYSPEYLVECATETDRAERLAELRRRIEQGAYEVDPEALADGFLRRQGT